MRFLSVLLVPVLALAAGGAVELTVEFAPGDFVFDQVNGYDIVALPGQYSTSEPGAPWLPLAAYPVLIPPDAEVTGIEVTGLATAALPGTFNIHPAQRPQAFSLPAHAFVPPDAKVYGSDRPWPAEPASFTRSGSMGGYRLAGVQVAPLRWTPATGHLEVLTRLHVTVRYERGRHVAPALDRSQVELMGTAAARLAVNPADAARFAPPVKLTDGPVWDYVIVTPASLRASFAPFVDWKNRTGFRTMVVTTESIYGACPGRDNQERIRNCIIDLWRNNGLKWLLVGGDAEVVPVRTARITCEGSTEQIATDFYYADLQYSWDSDHNNYFGEMTDSVDLFHDIFVGRTPADNAADVAQFIARCTTYANHPDTGYIRKVLYGSTMLFDPFHGRVINRMMAEDFPPGWQFAHLEDPPSGQYATQMSQGYGLSHVAAHGNQTSFSVMSSSECPGLSNGLRKLGFVNSIACQSGWFDGYECLAEALVKAPNGGAIATMLNSRYGYGYPPGYGPSEMLDLEWYRALIDGVADRFGTLAMVSKDRFQSLTMGQEVWRWCVYELNLLGDPTLLVWSDRPHVLTVEAPDSLIIGTQVVPVRVLDGTTPVPGALVCLTMGSDVWVSGRTDGRGVVELVATPAQAGSATLAVGARNCYPHEELLPVSGTAAIPALAFAGLRIDDSDGNGRLDPGETADLYISVANHGPQAATTVNGVLREWSPFLVITDSTASFGNVPAGDTVEGASFWVQAAGGTPNGTLVEFACRLTAANGTWEPGFVVPVGPPQPPAALWLDHDTGNVILTVTSLGSVGTLGPYREGSGMKWPRDAGYGSLYFTSLAAGNGPGYIVDRWYGQPSTTWNTDWRVTDTLRPVLPPIGADEEYQAKFDDGGHASPKGLAVTQWSGALAAPGYRDFVIVQYTLANEGAQPLNGLNVGIFSDFDVNNTTSNRCYTDNGRRLAYMANASSADPTVGLKLLSPLTAANVSAISNAIYIVPSGMMTEAVKDSFLRGAITVANPGSAANWSCVVSAGPFDLAPGARQKVTFAFVGGASSSELLRNADSAQSWYDTQMPAGVAWLKHEIDDAAGGNGDGIINPGEAINLPLWIVNRSDGTARGVLGTLRRTSGDTLVTVTDSVRYFGTVGPGDSAWTGAGGFGFRVARACTNGLVLPLLLACTDTLDSTFISTPPLVVGAPQLLPAGVMCWDPRPDGNGNGRLDPGETVDIALGLLNAGRAGAGNVSARLVSGDSRLVLLDSAGGYGSVPAESTVFNLGDRFRLQASGSIPRETELPCTLHVTGDDYAATRVVMVAVGMLTNVDPVPDGPRTPAQYWAYDDCDTFYVAAPVFEWVDITGVGTRTAITSDDQTVQVSLPPAFGPFVFYGRSFTQLSVCGNGWVGPGYTTRTAYSNTGIPATNQPTMMALTWDDLYPPSSNGVWWYHDEANHRFIIQYDSMPYYSNRTTPEWFQLIIYDTTLAAPDGNSVFEYQYLTAGGYGSCTVGENDSTAGVGLQMLFDGSYHRAASTIVPGRAVLFTTDSVVTGIAGTEPAGVLRLGLRLAPNPFRRQSSIALSLPRAGDVRLGVYDAAGRRVREVHRGPLVAGNHRFAWDRKDDEGRTVAAGVYLFRVETDSGELVRKAVVLR